MNTYLLTKIPVIMWKVIVFWRYYREGTLKPLQEKEWLSIRHTKSFARFSIHGNKMTMEWWWCKTSSYTYLTEGHHLVGLFLRTTFAIRSISVSKQIVHAFVSQHWKRSRHLASSRHKYIWTVKLHSLRKNKILILAKTKTPDRITNHWKNQHSSGGLHSHRGCCYRINS